MFFVEFKLWPLDITYGVVGGVAEVRIFAIGEGGERVTVTDRSFKPYFYVECADCVGKLPREVEKVEVVERKFFGQPRQFLKVSTRLPEHVKTLRETFASMPGVVGVYEADIRYYMRYLIDAGVLPCSWNLAEVREVGKLGSTLVYEVEKWLGVVGGFPPQLRVLAFDIEVYNERGTPDPARDPVVMAAVKTSNGGEEVFEAVGTDDKSVLRNFANFVREYDPDVIVGYNNNGFDWPYLTERAKAVGVSLKVDRLGGQPQSGVYGHWSVIGRANVDLYNIVEEFSEIKVKTLDRVAEYFGVMKRGERVLIPGHKIYEYWRERREVLRQYVLDDVKSTYGLGERLLPFLIELSSVSGLPLDQVAAASVGNRVEWMLLRYAHRFGEVAPNRVEREYEPYKGAIVLTPKPGLYSDVLVLDFTSMYPNIMIRYNLSPDTYVQGDGWLGEIHIAPEVGHKFRASPPGFFPTVLKTLIELRKAVREEMKRYPVTSPQYRILDERQKALKIMANAIYGYTGWVGARWYKREVAESVTAFGRAIMRDVVERARELDISVIYGDTDSLFVKSGGDVERLMRYVEEKYGIEVKIDKDYKKLLFTEAKKRYAGLLKDGRVDIVGFEVVRGDWCELAKEIQLKVLEIILHSRDVQEAKRNVITYVKREIEKLRSYNFEVDNLIIWKTLDKELGEYKSRPPHLHAALILKQRGYRVGRGVTIGYVIVKGGEKVSNRAMPYIFVNAREIDVDYYINHQIIPAAVRIGQVVGVRESDFKTGEKSLLDFI